MEWGETTLAFGALVWVGDKLLCFRRTILSWWQDAHFSAHWFQLVSSCTRFRRIDSERRHKTHTCDHCFELVSHGSHFDFTVLSWCMSACRVTEPSHGYTTLFWAPPSSDTLEPPPKRQVLKPRQKVLLFFFAKKWYIKSAAKTLRLSYECALCAFAAPRAPLTLLRYDVFRVSTCCLLSPKRASTAPLTSSKRPFPFPESPSPLWSALTSREHLYPFQSKRLSLALQVHPIAAHTHALLFSDNYITKTSAGSLTCARCVTHYITLRNTLPYCLSLLCFRVSLCLSLLYHMLLSNTARLKTSFL